MHKKIEDRAIAWSKQHREMCYLDSDEIAEVSYNQGAIDQRKIDIDKACELCEYHFKGILGNTEEAHRLAHEDFRKAMEV